MRRRIDFLLGRPPGEGSVLPDVVARLAAWGHTVHSHLCAELDPPALDQLARADLIVLRGLAGRCLELALVLEERGARCCNRASATARVRDKALTTELLALAGLPVPRSWLLASWDEVCKRAAGRAVVVKPASGSRGRGVVVLAPTQVPVAAPYHGPYLVQERIAGDGLDRKLYVVGRQVYGVLRRWPPGDLAAKRGRAFEPSSELRDLALAAGGVMGLHIYGVDVVVGRAGPVVVDVNAFPGFKGVPEAVPRLAEALEACARREAA